MTLGERIKQLRLAKGWKVKDLALVIKVTPGHINIIERDQIKPSINVLGKLANIFEITIEELLKGELMDLNNLTNEQLIDQFEKAMLRIGFSMNRCEKVYIKANQEAESIKCELLKRLK